MTNLTVYKSNKVVEAAYKLSLNEQKIILACIAKNDSNKPLSVEDKFVITAREFAELTGVELNNAYGQLKEVADNLFNRYVIINNPDATNPKIKQRKTRWISSIDYIPDSGALSLRFAYDMLPYLSELKEKFTRYELKYIGGMTSKYGIRIYELLVQHRSFGRREIAIDWLRMRLEIESAAYKSIADFKKYVIDAAVADINKHSDLTLRPPIYTKTGRNVTHITFDFEEKKAPTPTTQPKSPKAEPTAKPVDNVDYFVNTLNALSQNVELRKQVIKTIPPEILEQVLTRATSN